ncbi:MAG: hypothetical protein V1754_02670 [Pseudomonadota bacterium]
MGKFLEAAEKYEKAYAARPLPVFLFNLAQCHMRMPEKENLEKAVHYFQSFLENEPSAPNSGAVKEQIQKLKQEIAQLRGAPKKDKSIESSGEAPSFAAATNLPEKKSSLSQPWYKKWWVWSIVGAVVAGATVGIVVGVSSSGSGVPEGNEIQWGDFKLGRVR